MKWFYNLRIGVKLLAGFIIVALIAGGIGLIGVININKVNELDNKMYEKMTAPLGELVSITDAYQEIRSDIRDVVLTENQAEMTRLENKIKEESGVFDSSLDSFGKTLLTDEGNQLIGSLKKAKENYIGIANQIVKLVKEGKEQDAIALINGDAQTAANEAGTALDRITELKLELAKETADGNKSTAAGSTFTTVILLVVGMLVAVCLGIFISASINRPVKKLMAAAGRIADGDLNLTVEAESKDEIGSLAGMFKKMVDNLNEVMGNISTASEQVASGARQVSDSSMALSQGATEQASSVEELTASLEEISAQTRQNADSANQANELAESAKTNAIQGNDQMKEMLKSMDEINDSSGSISRIIKVIDEIAFQTNILALNAAVEAARAGQHGKGFAVVAEEVRNLAARSANAAKETTALIEGSIKKVEGGTRIANETAVALNGIVEGITKAAALVGDIAVASNEQALGIAQVNQGIMQVSTVIQTNSATSEESAAASEELSSQAQLLKDQVARFKLRKSQRSATSYAELENMDPEVLKMLENMSGKKQRTIQNHEEAAEKGYKKIALSDNEFGKY